MAQTRYRKKEIDWIAVQYDGTLEPLEKIGLKFSHTEWKDVHVGVYLHTGHDKACRVGDWVVKSDAGEIEILSPEQFQMKYEVKP